MYVYVLFLLLLTLISHHGRVVRLVQKSYSDLSRKHTPQDRDTVIDKQVFGPGQNIRRAKPHVHSQNSFSRPVAIFSSGLLVRSGTIEARRGEARRGEARRELPDFRTGRVPTSLFLSLSLSLYIYIYIHSY